MFTGIVQKVGRLGFLASKGGGWSIGVISGPWEDGPLKPGESVAVQGCCLTVCSVRSDGFSADVLDETLAATALSSLREGAALNLERALRPCDRLGGHIVQGHVDGKATLLAIDKAGRDYVFRLRCRPEEFRYIVHKGSVALDGTSLTVSKVAEDCVFEVNLIPTTLRETSLRERHPGDTINLETDILGRYAEAFLSPRRTIGDTAKGETGLSLSFLRAAGFFPAGTTTA